MRFCPRSEARRPGFTLLEVLIAAGVMLLLLAISYGMFIWTWKSFIKGDDTLTSVYDASLLVLHLRRDVLRMEFPDGEPADLTFERQGTNAVVAAIDYQWSARQLTPSTSTPPSPPASAPASFSRVSFYQRHGTDIKQVTYTYFPERHLVKRTGGIEGGEKIFSMPRLQQFELELGIQTEGTSSVLYLPAGTLGAPMRPSQLWVRAHVRVQSERREGEAAKTSVELSSLIFPKRLNKMLRSRWGR